MSVSAIGPLAVHNDGETGKLGQAFQTVEAAIENRNKAMVPKERSFREQFSGVSEVSGCYAASGRNSRHSTISLPVRLSYNPLALSPPASGQLGVDAEEWAADLLSEDNGEAEWSVRRLS